MLNREIEVISKRLLFEPVSQSALDKLMRHVIKSDIRVEYEVIDGVYKLKWIE